MQHEVRYNTGVYRVPPYFNPRAADLWVRCAPTNLLELQTADCIFNSSTWIFHQKWATLRGFIWLLSPPHPPKHPLWNRPCRVHSPQIPPPQCLLTFHPWGCSSVTECFSKSQGRSYTHVLRDTLYYCRETLLNHANHQMCRITGWDPTFQYRYIYSI